MRMDAHPNLPTQTNRFNAVRIGIAKTVAAATGMVWTAVVRHPHFSARLSYRVGETVALLSCLAK